MCSYKKRKKRKKWRRRSRSSDGFGATFRVHCSVKKARCLRPDIVYSFSKMYIVCAFISIKERKLKN